MSHAARQPGRSLDPRSSLASLLKDIRAALKRATIREVQIRHDRLFIFGWHDTETRVIDLNVPLLRVMVALHELTHHVRPKWEEDEVVARSTELLHAITDNDVATLNRAIVRRVRSRRRTSARRGCTPTPGCSR
jgi:hypothetical protein